MQAFLEITGNSLLPYFHTSSSEEEKVQYFHWPLQATEEKGSLGDALPLALTIDNGLPEHVKI